MKNFKVVFIISLVLFVFAGFFVYTKSLGFRLKRLVENRDAKIGICVIKGDETLTLSREKQPLMSVFKYFVALKVLNKLDTEKIALDEKILVNADMVDKNMYSPMLSKYREFPVQISIAELLEYMVSQSDNNACDILIEYAGGIDAVAGFVHNAGFADVEIFVNEKEMNKNIENQYLNRAYPADVAKMMKAVREGNVLSGRSSGFLEQIMVKTSTGGDKLKSGLPENVTLAHKTGSSSRRADGIKIADNDAGYVILPDGRVYYIVVLIENSKMSDTENAALISEISKIVYDYVQNSRKRP